MSPVRDHGATTVHFEPPDLVVAVLVGNITGDLVHQLASELQSSAAGKSDIFVVVDASRAGMMTADGRKAALEETVALNVSATALIGASFQLRVTMMLLAKAVALLRRKPYPFGF